MFRISQLQGLMKGLPRAAFDRIVQRHGANKHVKRFGAWDQLVAMVYGQCAGATSLRTLEAGFNQHAAHHYHLGTRPLRRSTLADANAQRDPTAFAEVAQALMGRVHRRLRRQCEPMLYLLDSTSLTLTGPGFDAWTAATATRNTQGVKVHVLYAESEQVPTQVEITAPNVNDIDHGRTLPLEQGAMYVFDKGYCDYGWWHRIDQAGAHFVTRFKTNASLIRVQECALPADAPTVLADELVRFKHRCSRGGHRNPYTQPLRRITITRPEHDRPLVLATNDLTSPAQAIAERYRDRWQIELFFKWIKQHLHLTRFLGRTSNAVRTQILMALITYLLLALYKQAHGYAGSLWMLLATLRVSLFQRPTTEACLARRRRQRLNDLAQRQPSLFW
jgi:putative transposase